MDSESLRMPYFFSRDRWPQAKKPIKIAPDEMNTDLFFEKIRTYHNISEQAELAWKNLLRLNEYKKGDNILDIGQYPKKVSFVINGLLSQNYIGTNGDVIIKYFFPE